jgi:hypothetical protein
MIRLSMFIPLSRHISAASGGDWEGTGVQPDAVCDPEAALLLAHRLARTELDDETAMSASSD